MLIESSNEHKSLTILISLTNVKKYRHYHLDASVYLVEKNSETLVYVGGGYGERGVPRGKKFGNNYPKQLSKRILVNAVG